MLLHTRTRLGMLIPVTCLFLIVVLVACGGPVSLQTYKGNGYAVGYPQDWTLNTQGQIIDFANSDNTARFVVEVEDDPQGTGADSLIYSAAQDANTSANLKYVLQNPVSATVQFGGEIWQQQEFDGTNANGIAITIDYLLANHQSGSAMKIYFLGFAAPVASFDQTNSDYFQPMLKSFVFTS